MDGMPQSIEPKPQKKAQKSEKKGKGLFGIDRPVPKSPGRPKKTDVDFAIEAEAKKHAKAALATLVEVIEDKEATAPARVSAANSILDRGFGKPKQDVNHNVEDVADVFSQVINAINEQRRARISGDVVDLVPLPEDIRD